MISDTNPLLMYRLFQSFFVNYVISLSMKMALHQISSKTKVGKIKTKMRTKSFWHYLVPEDLSVVVVVVVVFLSVLLIYLK